MNEISDSGDRAEMERRHAASLPVYLPEPSAGSRRVALVGAGTVNLVVAWRLLRDGCQIDVFDARPDPSTRPDWRRMGCTFSGYGARIFSLTEGRQHHAPNPTTGLNDAYRRRLDENGWLCCAVENLDAHDLAWIARHERVPGWLLSEFGHDIESFNMESANLWDDFRATAPEVFNRVDYRGGLIRTYPDADALKEGFSRECRLGAKPIRLSLESVAEAVPALECAIENGELHGALRVRGFSLNVHSWGRNLVRVLAVRGVRFHWETEVACVRRSLGGSVEGLETRYGPVSADAYVLSPGAFGGDLLTGFRSENRVAAVVGPWVSIYGADPRLGTPLKITRQGFGASSFARGANVIPVSTGDGPETLHVSSGHGFVGLHGDRNPSDAGRRLLLRAAEETAQRYFPAYVKGRPRNEWTDDTARYCSRPWTDTGLGLFETAEADKGGVLIVVGGHNTGGFAQSPAIAEAVSAALQGNSHPMHYLYHPERF